MEVDQRIRFEQAFHDRQAETRATFFRGRTERLLVADDEYLDHEPWIRPALAKMGDVRGRRVLDFGCGHGMAAVVLAKRGAKVTAFDLSRGYLAEARARACANEVQIDFVQANGEFLPFANGSFHGIWGNAVLHHLDLDRAGRGLRRVLKPGGLAVFCEPWGGNPFLNWARRHLPYPRKERTPRERPLMACDLAVLGEFFERVEVTGYQFLSMASRVLKRDALVRTLRRWDASLLKRLPCCERWCRYVVLTLS
jgi:SAM-dependent methyltransferase